VNRGGDLLGGARAHPTVTIVVAETEIGWLPYLLERMHTGGRTDHDERPVAHPLLSA